MKPPTGKALKTLVRVLAFLLTVALGALIFSKIEYNSEDSPEVKEKLLEALKKDMQHRFQMTGAEFENFTQLSCEVRSPPGPAWGYFDGLWFAFQTLTAIGYGNITPVTSLGQIFCIVYALLGIPLTILAFQSIGELLSSNISFLIIALEEKFMKREAREVEKKCLLLTFITMVLMIVLGSVKLKYSYNWTFLEGFYFWVITFTTIGYGDYIPGQRKPFRGGKSVNPTNRTAHAVFGIAWALIGLCVVSTVLNAIATFLDKRQLCWSCKVKICSVEDQHSSESRDPKVETSETQGSEHDTTEL